MRAKPGDRIVITPPTINGVVRDGEILEARGPDGGPPFRVRWTDGHEGLIFPGPGAMIHADEGGLEPSTSARAPASVPASFPPPGGAHVRDWTVRIAIFEAGDDTDAHVVLLSDSPTHLSARGHSHRGTTDRPVPEIGDEVAVARALRHLADELLATATTDIGAVTGERHVHVSAG